MIEQVKRHKCMLMRDMADAEYPDTKPETQVGLIAKWTNDPVTLIGPNFHHSIEASKNPLRESQLSPGVVGRSGSSGFECLVRAKLALYNWVFRIHVSAACPLRIQISYRSVTSLWLRSPTRVLIMKIQAL